MELGIILSFILFLCRFSAVLNVPNVLFSFSSSRGFYSPVCCANAVSIEEMKRTPRKMCRVIGSEKKKCVHTWLDRQTREGETDDEMRDARERWDTTGKRCQKEEG